MPRLMEGKLREIRLCQPSGRMVSVPKCIGFEIFLQKIGKRMHLPTMVYASGSAAILLQQIAVRDHNDTEECQEYLKSVHDKPLISLSFLNFAVDDKF